MKCREPQIRAISNWFAPLGLGRLGFITQGDDRRLTLPWAGLGRAFGPENHAGEWRSAE